MKPTIASRDDGSILLVTIFPVLSPTEATEHFAELAVRIEQRERVAIVVDLSDVSVFSPTMRNLGAQEMQSLYRRVGSRVAGVAHVVRSAPTRGMLTAIHWLAPPPFVSVVLEDGAQALVWCRGRLRDPGRE